MHEYVITRVRLWDALTNSRQSKRQQDTVSNTKRKDVGVVGRVKGEGKRAARAGNEVREGGNSDVSR